jgi:hypothetical protein
MKRSALQAIARSSDRMWVEHILEDLDHSDASVRFEAVNALGEIGEEIDASHLAGPLDDDDLLVQTAAVAAVEKLGGIEAKRLLQIASQSPEPSVARAAEEALKGIAGDEELVHTITPAMARQGLFGARLDRRSDDTVLYDAGEREGWGSLDEEGVDFLSPDSIGEDDDDPLKPIEDYEATPGQHQLDDDD